MPRERKAQAVLAWMIFLLLSTFSALIVFQYANTMQIEQPLMVKVERARGLFIFESPVFRPGETIPKKYTCDGEDIFPPLEIQGVKEGTKSLAILVEDIDSPGGRWVHWIVWNLPPYSRILSEGSLPYGAVEGRNSWGTIGYRGPCPPFGKHRYYFRVYALSEKLNLRKGATKEEFLEAIKGKVIDRAEFYGTYER